MKLLYSPLFFLSSLLFFSSCEPNQYAGEIKTLDSLYVVLEKTEADFKAIDPEQTKAIYDEIMYNLGIIQKNFRDTLDMESGFLLSDYRSMRKPFDSFSKNYSNYVEEMDFTKKQLKALIKDLKNEAIEPEKAREYFAEEYAAAIAIEERARFLAENTNKGIQLIPETQEKVINFIDNKVFKD